MKKREMKMLLGFTTIFFFGLHEFCKSSTLHIYFIYVIPG